ncbi:MAG: DEAD/DEAH box helicase [Desulfobacterales bacterium]|nr:DEAD/DEAH box helicase [Desulfobacterales bacterium]
MKIDRTDTGSQAPDVRLTPTGRLCWEHTEGVIEGQGLSAWQPVFQADWREGLFTLAAEKIRVAECPALRFWQDVGACYLTRLCHISASQENFEVRGLETAECLSRILTAPPMQGGEYLSVEVLQNIWNALDGWVHERVAAAGSLEAFLQARAPRWHQVGSVCFHLAENKNDAARPFAFMATYAAGFGAAGQLKHLPLRKALEQYAGAKNRPALIKLLSPVQQAAGACPWVKNLIETRDIYRPMAWPVGRAYRFLQSVPALEDSGLTVRLPNWWKKRPRPQVSVTIGAQKKAGLGAAAVLDFDVKMALGDETLSAGELAALLNSEEGLVFLKGQWVEVDREKLKAAIDHWDSLRKQAEGNQISFVEGMRLLAGASADLTHEDQVDAERPWVHVKAGDAMREVLAGLRDPSKLMPVDAGDRLQAVLRPYQREGLAWLGFLTQLGLGACLADDMGLGKTLQVLALLESESKRKSGRRSAALLVIPASLLGNWRNEATRFAPSLKLVFAHPAETDRKTLEAMAESPETLLADVDLVVTTYSMVARLEWLAQVNWQLVILDEAQAIKNSASRQSRSVKKLSARARIALTGTPVENRLGDLWSLFDFLNPGLLGSAAVFKSFIKGLQMRKDNPFAPLRQLVGPYILRRLKTDRSVISDLPEKTETPRYCSLTRPQVQLYEKTVQAMKRALEASDGMARRGLVLQSLMRLKQICNHPSQLSGDGEYRPDHSGKFLRIAEICEELADRQEKVLIFTQFREIIEPLAAHLAGVFGRSGLVLHGGTGIKQRKAIVDQFQDDDGPPFFILSLKAGGTGLNLTAASHVIHFDRWWNPAVENQATDRAFRIGQKRNVMVHKFITRGTIEERIDAMISEKRQLAEQILSGGSEVNLTELSDEELIQLVRLDVTRATV